MIPLYRSRPQEVRAIDLGDGRHLLLGEVPRYVASEAFLEAFELVEEQRKQDRRRANGHGRGKKKERRTNPGRRQNNGDDSNGAEARRLFEQEGKPLPEVARLTGLKYHTLYGRSKREKWKQGTAAPAPTVAPRGPGRPTAQPVAKRQDPPADSSWMQ